jgi:predicted enzyme related to lactoylglutathione lyase
MYSDAMPKPSSLRTPAQMAHFAINADDIDRAQRFYERVFAWRFEPWGPPNFFQIRMGRDVSQGIRGALQKRRFFTAGERIVTAECSFAVEDIDAVASAVTANGGSIVIPKVLIPTVGHLLFFRDPEGNVMGAAQYDPHSTDE